MTATRRNLLAASGALATFGGPSGAAADAVSSFGFNPDAPADDEAYWAGVAGFYDKPEGGIVQLENGQFGAMASPVRRAYEDLTRRVNRETTVYTRGALPKDLALVRLRVSQLLGVAPEEILLSRGATESLQALIGGYNRLRPGDAVLYADLDYDAMQSCMEALARVRGVRVVKINLPEPATRQGLIDAYEKAFLAHPSVRMALVTHLSHRTGLIPPIAEIARLARARNVDLILDGGHALGQTEFRLKDLGVDFAGLNLHKWVGAPLGVGVVYIRRDRIADVDVALAAEPGAGIEARLHTGTVNAAAMLAVTDALAFQDLVGIGAKARRLRYLRDRWALAVRANPRVEVLTPDDEGMHAGLTSFRVKGITGAAENAALRQRLFDRHRIMTVERAGPWRGACIRVTPSFINGPDDLDALVRAIDDLT